MSYLRFALLVAVVSLGACGSGLDRRYLDTSLGKPLELPPDLSHFEVESTFDLPKAFGEPDPVAPNKVPVLARVDSLQLQGSGDFYWLSVDEPAESLYQKIKNFWAFEGFGLVLDEPVIGIMQTEWIYTEEGGVSKDASWWESLFSGADLSATQDQFRTRIERDQSGSGSRIYLTHRGTEFVHEVRIGDVASENRNTEWNYRRSEPELEVEMLSRMMIYLGLQQEAVDTQKARVQMFKPRAVLEVDLAEKSPYLMLKDPYQIAWNRVHQILQRMNFEIDVAEFQSGLSNEGVFIVKADIVQTNTGQGFFNFGSSAERRKRSFTLVLSEETHETTRVVVEDEKGNFDTSPEGAEFISLLYQQIR